MTQYCQSTELVIPLPDGTTRKLTMQWRPAFGVRPADMTHMVLINPDDHMVFGNLAIWQNCQWLDQHVHSGDSLDMWLTLVTAHSQLKNHLPPLHPGIWYLNIEVQDGG